MIRHHVEKDDKQILDKEMKRICHLGILKEDFLVYSSPVRLIDRKLTKDKGCVSDFRHINNSTAKTNLVFPL